MKGLKFILLCFAVLLIAGPSCQKFNLNTDDLDVKLDLNVIKTHITVQFHNSATGKIIESDNNSILILVFGPDSQWVVNKSGERKYKFQSGTGYLSIGLDPYHAKPTSDDPVTFTLYAQLPGYLPASLPVTLTTEGGYDFVVNMVEMDNPPAGSSVFHKKNIGRMAGGVLEGDIEVGTKNGEVFLKIPKGTIISDKRGMPLDGQLDIMISYFDPSKAESLASFPGGLSVEVTGETGNHDHGVFNPAGFIAIEILDTNGWQAVQFEKGDIDLKAAINQDIINRDTGQRIGDGDKVPVWSYNDETGKWKNENTSVILSGPSGLSLSTHLPHLSWWSFNWFESSCNFGEISFTTADKSKTGEKGWGYNLYYVATVEGSNRYLADGYFNGYPELTGVHTILNTEILRSVPLNSQVRITFSAVLNTTPLWVVPEPVVYDFCSGTPLEIPLSVNSNTTGDDGSLGATITFNIEIFCTEIGASADLPDNTILRCRIKGRDNWILLSASGGQVTIGGFLPDTPYEVEVLYNDVWKTTPLFQYHVETPSPEGISASLRFDINCGG